MLYQNILAEDESYVARASSAVHTFPEHRHADIEIHYCLSGEIDILLDRRPYRIKAGELIFIGPMVSHEIPVQSYGGEQSVLTFIVGISFLREHFNQFAKGHLRSPIFSLDGAGDVGRELRALLDETAEYSAKDRRARLIVQGNLYKICYYLMDLIYTVDVEDTGRLKSVENIDRALELIYYDYRSPLTIEDAAEITGYSKSNFCRIFKNITGETFHSVLNAQRVEVAARLLSETNLSLGEIAELVGLFDAKKLCRVFKEIKGVTPGSYRKAGKR